MAVATEAEDRGAADRPRPAARRPTRRPGRAGRRRRCRRRTRRQRVGVRARRTGPSLISAVGTQFIDRFAASLKDLAIAVFGTNDKAALIVGIVVVSLALGALLGSASVRRPWVGVAGFIGFGARRSVVLPRRSARRSLDRRRRRPPGRRRRRRHAPRAAAPRRGSMRRRRRWPAPTSTSTATDVPDRRRRHRGHGRRVRRRSDGAPGTTEVVDTARATRRCCRGPETSTPAPGVDASRTSRA